MVLLLVGGGGWNSELRTDAITVTVLLLNRQLLLILNIKNRQNKVLRMYSSHQLLVLAERLYNKAAAHSAQGRLQTGGCFNPPAACLFNYQLLSCLS